jgi:hypothetical protein
MTTQQNSIIDIHKISEKDLLSQIENEENV